MRAEPWNVTLPWMAPVPDCERYTCVPRDFSEWLPRISMVFVPLSSLEMYVFFTTKMGASLGMQGEEGTADEGSLGSTLRSLPLKYEVKVSRLLFRFFGLGNSASLPFFIRSLCLGR